VVTHRIENRPQNSIFPPSGTASQLVLATGNCSSTDLRLGITLSPMFYLVSARFTRITLVPMLALWIAGTGCLLGCESRAQAATSRQSFTSEDSGVVVADACASSRSHGCCQKQGRAEPSQQVEDSATPFARLVDLSDQSGAMLECPFATSRVALFTKIRDNASPPALNQRSLPLLPLSLAKFSTLSDSFLPRDRGHTYLRCCVFLI